MSELCLLSELEAALSVVGEGGRAEDRDLGSRGELCPPISSADKAREGELCGRLSVRGQGSRPGTACGSRSGSRCGSLSFPWRVRGSAGPALSAMGACEVGATIRWGGWRKPGDHLGGMREPEARGLSCSGSSHSAQGRAPGAGAHPCEDTRRSALVSSCWAFCQPARHCVW